jgi:hypothetical protein
LEDCALLILWPATRAAPYRHENAGEARDAGENAVEKADPRIGGGSPACDRFDGGTKEGIEAVES